MKITVKPPHRLGLLVASLSFALAGCALVPGESRVALDRQVDSRHHYYHEPKSAAELKGTPAQGAAKLNPKWWVGNWDDAVPDWWKPEASEAERARSWFLRNPFHNFTGYVIGVADRHNHRMGINAHSIWNDKGSFNATVNRAGPLLYLPMVSNRGRAWEWYLGWRVNGSFGAAFRRAQHPLGAPAPPSPVESIAEVVPERLPPILPTDAESTVGTSAEPSEVGPATATY